MERTIISFLMILLIAWIYAYLVESISPSGKWFEAPFHATMVSVLVVAIGIFIKHFIEWANLD